MTQNNNLLQTITLLQKKIVVCNQTISEILNANLELRTTNLMLEDQAKDMQKQLEAMLKDNERLNRVVLTLDKAVSRDVMTSEQIEAA